MERLQMIHKAKTYLEKLADSIDPITQKTIEDPLLKRQEIKDTFIYIISLLDELIDNNGEVININDPIEFTVDRIDKCLITVSNQPIQVSGFVKRINKQVDKTKMATLKPSFLTEWLLNNGFINKEKRAVLKDEIYYSTTSSSKDVGIVEQDRTNTETGEIRKVLVLTKKAQEFIVDNLENIIGNVDEIVMPKVDDNEQDVENAWQVWTEEEQERLICEFTKDKLTIEEIASIHHRRTGGIRSRLKKLGLIER